MALRDIEHFVIVIMENRSFDHACGYLSLGPDALPGLEGLKDDPTWRARYANDGGDGSSYQLHVLDPAIQNIEDLPHEDTDIATQIGTPTHANASPKMGGFVKSYLSVHPQAPGRAMGYYDHRAVPVFDFFVRHYAICDHWFSSLPAGTQANRLMAMAGESYLHHNVSSPFDFPQQHLVYDWATDVLGANSWCCYQWAGLPFFSLMPRWWGRMVLGHNDPDGLGEFRPYDKFEGQWKNGVVPKIIFIEPKYTDDPTPSFKQRNDDHCPTGLTGGQNFLADIYNTMISNPELWQSSMLIVIYDEHGGFFDHVEPLAVPAVAGGKTFGTTGVRVPAFLISPRVKPGVISEPLDNTSILHLLADRFTPGTPYSPAVAGRQTYFKPLSAIIDSPAAPPRPVTMQTSALQQMRYGQTAEALNHFATPNPNAQAFGAASDAISRMHPDP